MFYSLNEKNQLSEQTIEKIFLFLCSGKHIISFVGAGGKTTLMYELADFCAAKGLRTLVTTTTRMYEPDDGSFAESEDEIKKRWDRHQPAVVGEQAEQKKIKMMSEPELYHYMDLADIVFVEADGAKGKSCKVPRGKEPVFLPECDIVIGVTGLDAVGKAIDEVCFCIEETKSLLGKTGEERLCEEDIVKILLSEQGTRKGTGQRTFIPVLNKCDVPNGRIYGLEILKKLKEQGIAAAFLSCREHA